MGREEGSLNVAKGRNLRLPGGRFVLFRTDLNLSDAGEE